MSKKKKVECKEEITRRQIFGNPDEMGTLEDIKKEIAEQEEEEAALADAEAEEAAECEFQAAMTKRGMKGIKKFK